MTKRYALILPLLLAACASAPKQEHTAAAKPVPQPVQPTKPVLPDVELSDDLLYEFLVGEMAHQRGKPELAAQTYLDLARSTRDPRVARRAAQLAFESHQVDTAIEAFKLWIALEPDSRPAKEMLASVLISSGRLSEALPLLSGVLSADQENAGAIFVQIYALLARQPDKAGVLKLMRDLAKPYPKLPEAQWVVAQAAAAAGKPDEALERVRQARALRPDWEAAAILEAQLLRPKQPQQALALLKDFSGSHKDAHDARLAYARMLLDQQQYKESRIEFQALLKDNPESLELALTVALISLQVGELDRAEKELQQVLARGKRDHDTASYYLGQLYEAKKDPQAALKQYRKVQDGEYAYSARLREVYLLSTGGKLGEALDLLHRMPAQNNQQRVQLVLIEVQLLRDAKQYEQAFQVLEQGLQKFPDNPDFLYEGALLADKLGKPEMLEQLIRKLIELQPDNANAYNMLGYSLLERNVRIEEGMRLVEKAYSMSPNDAAIMDSVGWGHYRFGRLDKSLEFLRRAFAANPDPEIAAHLGEVLWVKGSKEEARKVWSGSIKEHPQSEALQAVMKKFLP